MVTAAHGGRRRADVFGMSHDEPRRVAPRIGRLVRTVGCPLAVALVLVLDGSASAGGPQRPHDGWIVFPMEAPESGGQIVSAPFRAGRQRVVMRGGLRGVGDLAPSPDGKLIAVTRGEGVRPSGIWLLRVDGTRLRPFTGGVHPTWSPDGRRLAFIGRRGLMTIGRDGSRLRHLVSAKNVYPNVLPVWSPVGDWIAYMTRERQIGVVRPDGKRSHRVAKNVSVSVAEAFSWSPSGRQLAYVGDRSRTNVRTAIYAASVSGGRPKRLTHTPGEKFAPRWSPDGARIAFDSRGTWVVRVDGSAPARRVARGGYPSWSPDSSKLAVLLGKDVWVVRMDGRAVRRVSRGRESFSEAFGRPVWSANGRRVIFMLWTDVPGELMLISAAGDQRRRLTHNRIQEFEPSWSPDGRMVAFTGVLDEHEEDEEEIYVVRSDGTGLRRLTHRPGRDSHPTWSPDGDQIVFVRENGDGGSLYVVPSVGGVSRRLRALPSLEALHPAWAPGQWIALDGIELVTAAGEYAGRVTQPPGRGRDEQADWAPDGQRFAFVRTFPVGNSNTASLVIGQLGSSSVHETTASASSPSWSPDGLRIAAVVQGDGPGDAVVTMRPDGSGSRVVTVGVDSLAGNEGAAQIDWGPAR
jgi:TolB protein